MSNPLNKHKRKLSYYDYGATTFYACQYDQRFSYNAYIPNNYNEEDSSVYPLLVVIHGTNRPVEKYRDAFKDFAEVNNTIILVPVFPAGIVEPGDLSSYKFIKSHGIHYDAILLAMIDEMAIKYKIMKDKFLLYGFSGGGQFAHRFFYLHPERLLGVSIGAPGRITYLNPTEKWYVGTQDIEEQMGISINLDEMRKVPVQMVIGDLDVETWEINDKRDPYWMEGFDVNGKTRVERLEALRNNFVEHGIVVQFDTVPEVGHKGLPLLPKVKAFFSKVLKDYNKNYS